MKDRTGRWALCAKKPPTQIDGQWCCETSARFQRPSSWTNSLTLDANGWHDLIIKVYTVTTKVIPGLSMGMSNAIEPQEKDLEGQDDMEVGNEPEDEDEDEDE